jgi:hypothetical protein
VIASYLSAREVPCGEERQTAELLSTAKHNKILGATYGCIPRGLRGALSRSGAVPHHRAYYAELYGLLSGSSGDHRVAIVRQLDNLDSERLEILEALPADLCRPRIVTALVDMDDARNLAGAVKLMSERGVNRPALCSVLSTSPSRASLGKTVLRWAETIRFPTPPIAACAGYTPIVTGRQLRAAALRFRNCARGYHFSVIAGEYAFGELTSAGQSVLLVFHRRPGYWCLDDTYRLRNRPLPPEMIDTAKAFACRHGVLCEEVYREKPANLVALRKVMHWADR